MKLCDRIKQYRRDNNLTQQDLANKLFVSRSAVAKWEQGRGLPDKYTQKSLSAMLGVPEEELLSQKELRNITIETANTVSKQKRSNLLIFIIIGVMSISLIVLFFCFPTKNEHPNIITESDYTYIDVNNDTITFYNYDKFNEKYSWRLGNNLSEIALHSNVSCFDRRGNETDISLLKSGYSVKITYSYPDNSKNDVTVNKIEIIDDFVQGDYYIKGYFLSTEAYNGDVIPIYNKSIGYTDYKPNQLPGASDYYEYCVDGIYYGPGFRYPYTIWFDSGYFTDGFWWYTSPQKMNNPANDCVLEYVYNVPVNLSSETNSLFIYIIDNSEKGFTFYSEVNTDTIITIPCLSYEEDTTKMDPKYSKSRYQTCNLNVVFNNNVEYVRLQEFDENHSVLKTTLLKKYEEISSNFKLQENTSYVIVAQNNNSNGIFVKGDKLTLSLSSKYGFIYRKQHITLT